MKSVPIILDPKNENQSNGLEEANFAHSTISMKPIVSGIVSGLIAGVVIALLTAAFSETTSEEMEE